MTDPVVVNASFEPDTPEFRSDFEAAYLAADLTDLPEGGTAAAACVQRLLNTKHPKVKIFVETGPHWIVMDMGPR